VFVAEIGDVHRFADFGRLCSWAGLTPTHRESTPWCAAGTSPNRVPSWCGGPPWRPSSAIPPRRRSPRPHPDRVTRGKNIAKIAVARKLLTLVYYGLRDGHIRALAPRRAA